MAKSTTWGQNSRIRMTLTAQILGAVGGAVAVLIAVGATVDIQMGSIDASTRNAQADSASMSVAIPSPQNTLWAARQSAGTVASYPVADRQE